MFAPPPKGTYIVQPGDTLQSIAAKVLQDESLWTYLASINSIASPYAVHPGQYLKVNVAEIEADKRKPVPTAVVIGSVALLAAGIYWRSDIAAFFKRIF